MWHASTFDNTTYIELYDNINVSLMATRYWDDCLLLESYIIAHALSFKTVQRLQTNFFTEFKLTLFIKLTFMISVKPKKI